MYDAHINVGILVYLKIIYMSKPFQVLYNYIITLCAIYAFDQRLYYLLENWTERVLTIFTVMHWELCVLK